jgi:hypothetical protein
MTIEVFKTNVENEAQAAEVRQLLMQYFPSSRINFDLHDTDRILRVEGMDFTVEQVVALVNAEGVVCTILD